MSEYIAGRNPVIEALRSGTLIEKIYVLKGSHGAPIDTIRELARKKNILCAEITHDVVSKFGITVPMQGVIAAVGTKEYCEIEDILQHAAAAGQKPFVLIFDEIEDPHNLGALIRTAVCAGAHGGILSKHHSAAVTDTGVIEQSGIMRDVRRSERALSDGQGHQHRDCDRRAEGSRCVDCGHRRPGRSAIYGTRLQDTHRSCGRE